MSSPVDVPITHVQVDGLVALKIIRHVRESLPEIVGGQLLGLATGETLEVTHCFPIVGPSEDESVEEEQARLSDQISMMKHLRAVNVDSNSVGWYTAGVLASHMGDECIKSQFNYQTSTPLSVMLVFDPIASTRGVVGLRALRLSEKFMKLYSTNKFTRESLSELGLSFDDIYEELPIEIVNTGLLRALIWELEEDPTFQPTFNAFDLGSSAFLEKNLTMLIESVSDLQNEHGKVQAYQRQVLRQQTQQQSIIAKRKAENTQLKHAGLPLLSESLADLEQENPAAFKMPTEPSRFESLLSTGQTNHYCEEIINFGGQDLTKMFLAKAAK